MFIMLLELSTWELMDQASEELFKRNRQDLTYK